MGIHSDLQCITGASGVTILVPEADSMVETRTASRLHDAADNAVRIQSIQVSP